MNIIKWVWNYDAKVDFEEHNSKTQVKTNFKSTTWGVIDNK